MSSAAASGFVVLLLCVPVVKGQYGWGVTFTSTQICAVKGSTVEMSCDYQHPTYKNGYYPNYLIVQETFWFIKDSVDLKTDEAYRGRVYYGCYGKRCILTITDLRKSDSAVYRFRFITNQPGGSYNSPSGVTLSVTDPQLNVKISNSHQTKLTCLSDCILPDYSTYIWYNNGRDIGVTTRFYSGYFQNSDSISCAVRGFEDFPSASVYSPKPPSVSVSPSAEIIKGSSVNLTCSSDANPAANYNWYKKNGNPALQSVSNQPQLIFRSIRSSDSGLYYCTVENVLGRRTSGDISIDVKYPPKSPSVPVSPSAEIIEGSSVNLNCSSDANPAANYNWYKRNGNPALQSVSNHSQLIFRSIRSSDSGLYYCTVENVLGKTTSEDISIDVKYAPRLPSVSASPSGEIMEGSSATLTCSSDANPEANYTWYKENEDSPKASGQTFTITNATPKHSGKYYCEVRNSRGHQNSSLNEIIVSGSLKSVAVGSITAVVLAVIFLSAFLLMRRQWSLKKTSESRENPDSTAQDVDPQYDYPSTLLKREPTEQQDDLYYSSVRFCNKQEDPLYSNIMLARPNKQKEEEEDVEYTAVNFNKGSPGWSRQEAVENPSTLYSTVNKNHRL